ncbi:MAG: N-acetylmuramoyl-L-alanine amidase [Gammaproteobacteria bacterium]|nr:N-acetylmuramoyl-L-alanine amidase [Gammaproteobacteria bacterium]
MRRLAFLILLCLCSVLDAAELEGVRTWREPPRTRVVFDLSDRADYSVFTMRNPERVVIDFKATRTHGRLVIPPGLAGLRGLRHAVRGKDGLRVVLDLGQAMQVDDVLLPPSADYGYRLVVDLLAPGAPQPRVTPTPPPAPAPQPSPALSAPETVAAKPAPAVVTAAPTPVTTARARPARVRDAIVAIDAGHGGADVGAIGPSGVYEKDITLALARELAALIDRQPGMRAVMTRGDDRYLKLRERMDRARAQQADLFISLHADAFRDRRVSGSSVYVLSQRGASSEAAKWLADNENAADLIGGVSLDDKDDVLKSVLLDLSQTASIEASIDLANHVLGALKGIGTVHRKQVQHAGFMVLKSPDIPSILIETAFISNPTEEKRLRSVAYRRKLARAIHAGVAHYFDINPPPGTRMAEVRRHRVARGDTLSGIANRYDVSISSLKLANNLSSEMVRTGQELRIP